MRLTVCPLSVGVFLGTALVITWNLQSESKEKKTVAKSLDVSCEVVFVLGGPGAGKGTQCQLLTQRLGNGKEWAHLSAGDLLRAERQRGGELGDLINARIAAGQLVPSEVTCKLIENAMTQVYCETGISKFLIDGFPRSQGNATAWDDTMSKHKVKFVLSFECTEEVMVGRLLERAKTSGRIDDTAEVIRKRFQTYANEEAPIVEVYEKRGMVKRIAADKTVEDIYAEASKLFIDL